MERKELAKPDKSSSSEKITFSYEDLYFNDSFSIDNRKYVAFTVSKEKEDTEDFIIQCLRSEFLEYQNLFLDEIDKQRSNEECECNICTPQFKKLDDFEELLEIALESGATLEQTISTPVFHVWNLVEGFKIGICDLKNKK